MLSRAKTSIAIAIVLVGCVGAPPESDAGGVADMRGDDPDAADGTTTDSETRDVRTDASDVHVSADASGDGGPHNVEACGVTMPIPLVRWDMTETGGKVLNTGRGSAPPIDLDGAPTADGILGDALHIQTFDYQPHVSHHEDFELDQGTLTVWIAPTQQTLDSGEAGIFSKDAQGTDLDGHIEVELRSGELRFRLQRDGSGDSTLVAPFDYDAGTWHHVAVSWSDDGVEMFVDGASAADSALGWSIATNTEPIGIGFSTSNSSNGDYRDARGPFLGLIDEVAIWDTVLAPEIVAALSAEDCSSPAAPQ